MLDYIACRAAQVLILVILFMGIIAFIQDFT